MIRKDSIAIKFGGHPSVVFMTKLRFEYKKTDIFIGQLLSSQFDIINSEEAWLIKSHSLKTTANEHGWFRV